MLTTRSHPPHSVPFTPSTRLRETHSLTLGAVVGVKEMVELLSSNLNPPVSGSVPSPGLGFPWSSTRCTGTE